MLAEAARSVEATPWPKHEQKSFLVRMTGGGDDDALSRTEAIRTYLERSAPEGARFARLVSEAWNNIAAAEQFNRTALQYVSAPRRTKSDIVIVENTIQTLRAHKQIFTIAVRELEKTDEFVSDDTSEAVRTAYARAVKSLGETADLLAASVANDHSETLASPDRALTNKFSDL